MEGRKRIGAKEITVLIAAGITAAVLLGHGEQAADGRGQDASTSPAAIAEIDLHPVSGKDVMTFAIPAGAQRGAIEAAVRRGCAGRQWCQIYGWADPAARATAWPMTDRELAALGLRYALNRASGLEELTWYCGKAPQAGRQCADSE